jgi:hypothetical protein
MPPLSVHDGAHGRLHRAGWSPAVYSLAGRHGVVCVSIRRIASLTAVV